VIALINTMDMMDTTDIRMLAAAPTQVEKGMMVRNTIYTKDILKMSVNRSVIMITNAQALNGTKRRSVRYGTINPINTGLNG